MSRIGNKSITVPAGVEVAISAANEVTVKGPKGTLTRKFSPLITIVNDHGTIVCTRADDEKHTKQLHGTTRALINNMIIGVSQGYSIDLAIEGIGYRAVLDQGKLVLSLGYSHPCEYVPEEGITITVPTATSIKVAGIDKQRVGEVAANIRKFRRPEPYKGKGVRYKDEHVRRKEGKAAGK